MTSVREDFENLVAHTAFDHHRLAEKDAMGSLEQLLGPQAYADYQSGTGLFRIGITIGEREKILTARRKEARAAAGASRQMNIETVRCVMARHGLRTAAELDFVLALVPDLAVKIEQARLFEQEPKDG
jgi:hypothetical protein